jgi:hypothetical protein
MAGDQCDADHDLSDFAEYFSDLRQTPGFAALSVHPRNRQAAQAV